MSDKGTDKTKYDLTIKKRTLLSVLKGCKTALRELLFQAFKLHPGLQPRYVERAATGTKSWGLI